MIRGRPLLLRHASIAISILVLILIVGCSTNGQQIVAAAQRNLLEPGFHCLITPNAFDPPGVVFSIDPQGVKDYVADLSSRLNKKVVSAEIGQLRYAREVEASFVAKLLSVFEKLGAPTLEASLNSRGVLTAAYERPIQKEITLATDTKPILDWFQTFVKSDPAYRDDRQYFLIRDAYVAQGAKYQLDRRFVAALGGEAKLQSYVSAAASVKRATESGFDLTQTFPEPLRVCIRPQPLVVTGTGLAGGVTVELSQDFRGHLEIRSVRTQAPQR